MEIKNQKIANINVRLKDLFMKWLDVTRSFHKLNHKEQLVLSLFLYYHHIYKKEITNNKILWKIVFDYETKAKIKEDSIFGDKGLGDAYLQNVMSSLRKKKIIVKGEISPLFIPDLQFNSRNFKVIFNFNIVDNE